MVTKKPAPLAIKATKESTPAEAKPPKPVDMDRIAKLSKPAPKKKDPLLRSASKQGIRRLAKIPSNSHLLQNRHNRISIRK